MLKLPRFPEIRRVSGSEQETQARTRAFVQCTTHLSALVVVELACSMTCSSLPCVLCCEEFECEVEPADPFFLGEDAAERFCSLDALIVPFLLALLLSLLAFFTALRCSGIRVCRCRFFWAAETSRCCTSSGSAW